MSIGRDYMLEIQGDNTVFTGSGSSNPPVSWGQTNFVEAIISVPPIQSMTIDPYSGGFGNGGMSAISVSAAEWMNERKTSPLTQLTADLTKAATTVTVNSTTAFPSSGTIWIDTEAISYTSKTATTFTGCTRGVLGTFARKHDYLQKPANSKATVYGFNPSWFGKKCLIREFDPATNVATTIATGYIENVVFTTDAAFQFDLISIAQRVEDKSIATGMKARGRLRGVVATVQNRRRVKWELEAAQKSATLIVELENFDQPFPYDTTVAVGKRSSVTDGYIKMGGEVIQYKSVAYPAWTSTVVGVGTTAGLGPYIQTPTNPFFGVGDAIEFTDSATGNVIRTKIVKITNNGLNVYHSKHGYAPSVGSTVTLPALQLLGDLERKKAGTRAENHAALAEISQVWMQSTDHVDGVLRLLLSGNESGGTYDTLPAWIGAAIPDTEVDSDSFKELQAYALTATMLFEDSASPKDILTALALITGGRIFVTQAGKVKGRRDFALWPDTGASYSVTIDEMKGIPSWSGRLDRTYNHWSWKLSNGLSVNFSIDESSRLYRERSLPQPNQKLLTEADLGVAEAYAVATLMRYSVPTPEVSVEIAEEVTNILEPGQTVAVTVDHLPDQAGGEGLTSEYFEVTEYTPNGTTAGLRLLRLAQQTGVGLVAPAGIVESVSGSNIVLKSRTITHLAADTDRTNTPLANVIGAGEDGKEDVDWFLVGDVLQLIDESTLGNATPTTTTLTISSVNYGTRTITFTSSVPAWVAAGDYVRLHDYLTSKAAITQAKRTPYYAWWADSTPLLPGGDNPYIWGM